MNARRPRAALGLAALLPTAVPASIIVSDTFTYPDGDLAGHGPWFAAGTTAPVQVSSGQVAVTHGSGSRQDVRTSFSGTGSVHYYALDFSVGDLGAPYSGTNDQYFAHLNTSSFRALLSIGEPTGSGDFSIGIATNSTGTVAPWATDLSFDTVYRAVVGFNISVATLWVDPNQETDTSVTASGPSSATINGFQLRQSDSSQDETITVDNLVVATTFDEALTLPTAVPEPAETLVAFLGLTGLLAGSRGRKPQGALFTESTSNGRD